MSYFANLKYRNNSYSIDTISVEDIQSSELLINNYAVRPHKEYRRLKNKLCNLSYISGLKDVYNPTEKYSSSKYIGCETILVEHGGYQGFLYPAHILDATPPLNNHISFLSGPCLFSEKGPCLIDKNENKVYLTDIESIATSSIDSKDIRSYDGFNLPPTLYEIDSFVKLANQIGIFSRNNMLKYSLSINIPRVEYYLLLLSFKNYQEMPRDIFSSWLDAVDERNNYNYQLYKLLMHKTNNAISVARNQPLDFLAEHIKCEFEEKRIISLHSLISYILSTKTIYASILSTLRNTEYWPKDVMELGYLSYVVAFLSESLHSPSSFCFAVEDRIEAKILSYSRKILSVMELKPNLGGVYVRSNFFIESNCGNKQNVSYDQNILFNELSKNKYACLRHVYPFAQLSPEFMTLTDNNNIVDILSA